MDEQSKVTGMPQPAPAPSPIEAGKQQVRRLGDALRERALNVGEQRRGKIAGDIGRIAEKLEGLAAPDGGEGIEYARRAANVVRRLESTLGDHSTEELLGMAEQRIRRRPGLFLAGCFALGFGAARLLRK